MKQPRETPNSRSAPGRRLPDTSWTLLGAAKKSDIIGYAARAEFALRYHRPVHAYIRAIVRDPDRADDLTQGFFETKLNRVVKSADPKRGPFRPFLKRSVRNYLMDIGRAEIRAQRLLDKRSKKTKDDEQARGKKKRDEARVKIVRPDANDGGWERMLAGGSPAADVAYHVAWVRALLEEAIEEVRRICEQKNQRTHFDLFVGAHLSRTGDRPGWQELGARFGLDEKAARNRVEVVVQRFRDVLRARLVSDIGSPQGVDEEVAALLEGL